MASASGTGGAAIPGLGLSISESFNNASTTSAAGAVSAQLGGNPSSLSFLTTKQARRLSQQLESSRDEKWRKAELEAGAQIVAKLYNERGRSIFPADVEMAASTPTPTRVHPDLLLSGLLSVWTATWRERKWNDRFVVLTPRAMYLYKPNTERSASRFGPGAGLPSNPSELSKELFGDFRLCVPIDESTVIFEMFEPTTGTSYQPNQPNVPRPLPVFQISRPGKPRIICRAPTLSQACMWVRTLHGIVQCHTRALTDAASIHSLAEVSKEGSSAEFNNTFTQPPLPTTASTVPPFLTSSALSPPVPPNMIPPWATAATLRGVHSATIVASLSPVASFSRKGTPAEPVSTLAPVPSIALVPPAVSLDAAQIEATLLGIDTSQKPADYSTVSSDMLPTKLACPLSAPFGRSLALPVLGLADVVQKLPQLYLAACTQAAANSPHTQPTGQEPTIQNDLLGEQLGLSRLFVASAYSPSAAANDAQVLFEGCSASIRFNVAPLALAALFAKRYAGANESPAFCASSPIVGWSGEADMHVAIDIENIDLLPLARLDAILSAATAANNQSNRISSAPSSPVAAGKKSTLLPSASSSSVLCKELDAAGQSSNLPPSALSTPFGSFVSDVAAYATTCTFVGKSGLRVRKLLAPRLWIARINFVAILCTLIEFLGVNVYLFTDATQAAKEAQLPTSWVTACVDYLLFTSSGRLGLGLIASAGTSIIQCALIHCAPKHSSQMAASGASALLRDNQGEGSHVPTEAELDQDLETYAEDIWNREVEPIRKRVAGLVLISIVMLIYAIFMLVTGVIPVTTPIDSSAHAWSSVLIENGGPSRFAIDCLMLPFALFFFFRAFSISRSALRAINSACLQTAIRSTLHQASLDSVPTDESAAANMAVSHPPKGALDSPVPQTRSLSTVSSTVTPPIEPPTSLTHASYDSEFSRSLAASLSQQAQRAPRLKISFLDKKKPIWFTFKVSYTYQA